MTNENKTYLKNKYPNILQTNTQIDCGDGWLKLLDVLCATCQRLTDTDKSFSQLKITYIKEKFGSLRISHNGTKEFEPVIRMASYFSDYVCEKCGSTEGVTQTQGWVLTRCEKCMKEHLGPAGWINHKESLRKK